MTFKHWETRKFSDLLHCDSIHFTAVDWKQAYKFHKACLHNVVQLLWKTVWWQFNGSAVSNSCDHTDWNPPGSSIHEFPKQLYWSVLPFPSPGESCQPSNQTVSPTLQVDSLRTELVWEVLKRLNIKLPNNPSISLLSIYPKEMKARI